jgi:hypothetical protein
MLVEIGRHTVAEKSPEGIRPLALRLALHRLMAHIEHHLAGMHVIAAGAGNAVARHGELLGRAMSKLPLAAWMAGPSDRASVPINWFIRTS